MFQFEVFSFIFVEKCVISDSKIVIFQETEIRRTFVNDEWYFFIVDVVKVLTDSANPTDYLKKMRKRDPELNSYVGTNCSQIADRKYPARCRTRIRAQRRIDPDYLDKNPGNLIDESGIVIPENDE